MKRSVYLKDHKRLRQYLNRKRKSGDWHAVRDAAVDIEVLEAKWNAAARSGDSSTLT